MRKGVVLISILSFLAILFFGYLASADEERFTVILGLPLNSTIDLAGDMVFYYNATDLDYSVTACELIFDNNSVQLNYSITESVIQYFNLSNMSFGTHIWQIKCTNEIGNLSFSELRMIEIHHDSASPVVTLNGPAHNASFSDRIVDFNYSVTDDGMISNCSLFTDINNTWQINQTNFFVDQNRSLIFTLENIPDDSSFKWNVQCADFAFTPHFAWGSSNLTLTINNNNPSYSTIPALIMGEDSLLTLNLSTYFSDTDGDDLIFTVSNISNVTITIDNENNTALIEPSLNWYGLTTLIFYAFDDAGGNVSSGSVTLNVTQEGDTAPHKILTIPSSNYTDKYGAFFITCNATDDFNITTISVYTDIGGNWSITRGEYVNGTTNAATFSIETIEETAFYTWACKFEDTDNQTSWSQNYTVNVSIMPTLLNDITNYTINHVDHNRTILVDYSYHLNNTIILSNLTISLDDGTIYFTKNLSQVPSYDLIENVPRIIVYPQKFRIRYDDIFNSNYAINNSERLNLTLNYYFGNNSRHISIFHNITIFPSLSSPPNP